MVSASHMHVLRVASTLLGTLAFDTPLCAEQATSDQWSSQVEILRYSFNPVTFIVAQHAALTRLILACLVV